ncbi:toxin-antitoxin system YwqK family antitoxin [Flavobacterium sp. UMI-01]|uniref:toxin-antitoxin system YwqK family antitoxin n=1 Tax=Flavobacterium sp. UMI-01 TaxID=1441053 RepID=UPI002103A4E0|nr:toxin-antitoxin system YwqK family antitoxin [Flavobacterium sp. UMI-01]
MRFYCFIFLILSSQIIVSQSIINQFDAQGKKDGLWKGFYEDSKRLKYEGTFAHGKEIGVFKFFDDTKAGDVIATREFNAKDGSAYTIFYDQSKNKVSEGKVVNKQFEGEWKYYHQASPVIMTKENYKNGQLEGIRSVYYNSGKLAEETHYRNGMKEGVYKKYSENGIVLEEANYKANEFDGPAVYKEADGQIVSQGNYQNGKKVGIWKFFENGKLIKEENMSLPPKAKRRTKK